MRKRFQKGSVRKMHGAWIGRWRDDGQPQSKKLGSVSQMTKSQAWEALAEILRPINARVELADRDKTFGDFVDHIFFPTGAIGYPSPPPSCPRQKSSRQSR